MVWYRVVRWLKGKAVTEMQMCRSCSASFESSPQIRLWDGADYCRDCLGKSGGQLLEYSQTHNVLESQIVSKRRVVKRAIIRWAVLTIGITFLFLWITFYSKADWTILDFVVMTILSSAIFALAMAGSMPRTAKMSVENGTVTITRKSEWFRVKEVQIPLSECRWFLGKTKDDKDLLRADIEDIPAIILIIKPGTRLPKMEVGAKRVACVMDPEKIELWEAFLEIADVPKTNVFRIRKYLCELFWIKNAKAH
jgi:hypothetical protein